ncbi:hypothetical protein P4T04_03195 [Bacillus badius]|uniref:hypothetical protein n=1 Tax=Bacillus badius TaxID=1455 RepID=UPI002E1C3A9C|nr:hypothetical protein [Bacillus badius]
MFEMTDIESIFDMAAVNVKVNDIDKKAIITNPAINEFEERYIHSLDVIRQGNLITYQNEYYLTIAESVTKRHGKFKTLLRHCNHVFEIAGEATRVVRRDENGKVVLDDDGRPVYDYIQGDPTFVPSIIENKNFSIDGQQLLVPVNEIMVIVKDNEKNKKGFAVNNELDLMSKRWKVLNQDYTKVGLIILTCEKISSPA